MTLKELQEQHEKEINRLLKRTEEIHPEVERLIDAGNSAAAREDRERAASAAREHLEKLKDLLKILDRKISGEQL